ncbi:MAG TPA: metal ABC transporter permease [candidate division Zixibacteria bacterium]|nr:metal ABC transporter permease [candidate division Zixibacteria bacterium]
MTEFFTALGHHAFLQNALLAGLLASVACGVVGTYVVVRRITYLAGGIAHSVLGGMGLARWLAAVHGWEWLTPLYGAMVGALVSALIIGWVSLRAREREDTVIGAIWAVGMAVGVIFISLTPGYNQELMSYLFGNILMVSGGDLWLISGLDAILLLLVLLFHNQFNAVCFDDEFARVRGLAVDLYYLLLLVLTALTVVVLVSVVGIVLVIALLTLPVAIAASFAGNIRGIMLLAVVSSAVITSLGLAVSYQPDLPAGAMIILVAASVYVVVLLFKKLHHRRRPVVLK